MPHFCEYTNQKPGEATGVTTKKRGQEGECSRRHGKHPDAPSWPYNNRKSNETLLGIIRLAVTREKRKRS